MSKREKMIQRFLSKPSGITWSELRSLLEWLGYSMGSGMKDMIKHKGYFGSVHYNPEDRVFYGKIESIRALVSYEGNDADSLETIVFP